MNQTKVIANVVAQKADPNATISKDFRGNFFTTTINVMEDGTERPYRVSNDRKSGLIKSLAKLPVENVKGMTVENGSVIIELFKYNGI